MHDTGCRIGCGVAVAASEKEPDSPPSKVTPETPHPPSPHQFKAKGKYQSSGFKVQS